MHSNADDAHIIHWFGPNQLNHIQSLFINALRYIEKKTVKIEQLNRRMGNKQFLS